MALLANPNLAYTLVVVGVTLLFLANTYPKTTLLNTTGLVLCLIASMLGFLYLRVNPWAFFAVALSPLLFTFAFRQPQPLKLLYVIAIFILAIAPFLLFVDQDNFPVISTRMAWVSVLSAVIIWISTERLRNVKGKRLSDDPGSVIGLIGKTITDIEPYTAGSVLVDGEVWQARSKEPIPAGSTVRVLRQDGFWLTVKKTEILPKK